MSVVQKKVCMLGAFAVGKTSLVRRFVEGTYSDRYLTTVGVKISQKQVLTEDGAVRIVLWDLYGEDDFQRMNTSYLRGADGLVFVIDGTRSETLEIALDMRERALEATPDAVTTVLVNKCDLTESWELDEAALESLASPKVPPRRTSALTGEGVEEAFEDLALRMIQ